VTFTRGIEMELDWLQAGPPSWDMSISTAEGTRVVLRFGGNDLEVDGETRPVSEVEEYPALYARMAELVERGESDVDLAPLVHVADAMTLGRRNVVGAFSF
jgi:D-galactose 1-dehydrogenase